MILYFNYIFYFYNKKFKRLKIYLSKYIFFQICQCLHKYDYLNLLLERENA